MSYVTEPDIRVKSYDHSNMSRASVVQFLASRYIMSSNLTSEWNFMTIRICRELSLFNFHHLDVMSPNRTSVWKVMTIRISQVLLLFNFERLDILCPRIRHPSEMLWTFEFVECFRCSISSVSIYYVLESDIGVKCYDQSNFPRVSVVQFRTSRYIMSANRTSVWRGMTFRISRQLPLFNFELLDILCPRIGHLCEEVWPFEFLESFRCSISNFSIYYVPESDICVKS